MKGVICLLRKWLEKRRQNKKFRELKHQVELIREGLI